MDALILPRTDALGALTLAVATISQYIDDDVKARTQSRLDAWFGRSPRRPRPVHDKPSFDHDDI